MEPTQNYHADYDELPFENVLRKYRFRKIVDLLSKFKAKNILEIGCGSNPLFEHYKGFEKMTIVELDEYYCEDAVIKAKGNPSIKIINKPIEDSVEDLSPEFDVIIISGFQHEIDNPEELLVLLKKICNSNTRVIGYVPNANSFHRVLAFEAGLIPNIYNFSENDKKFGRRIVWDINSFPEMFISSGYIVELSETYFIKPFAHKQMKMIMDDGILTSEILDGLDNMIKYMPDMGSEIIVVAECV